MNASWMAAAALALFAHANSRQKTDTEEFDAGCELKTALANGAISFIPITPSLIDELGLKLNILRDACAVCTDKACDTID